MFLYDKPGGKALGEVNPEMESRIEQLRAGRPEIVSNLPHHCQLTLIPQLISTEDIQHRMVLRFVNEGEGLPPMLLLT